MGVVRIGLAVVAVLYVAIAAGLYLAQRRILFRPGDGRPDLARAGLPGVRETAVRTEDGLDLLAWYRPPASPGDFVVLYLHGNGGNLGHRAVRIAGLAEHGWGTLMIEYRGYGGNPGRPSEDGLALDARAGLAALRSMGFPDERILVWGESLGTGVAVRLASENTVAAVLLESPFTSIAGIASARYWFMPVRRLLLDHFDSLGRIGRVAAPVLVMHGSIDRIVPVAMGREIYEAARPPKELWLAEGADHEELAEAGAIAAAGAFVRRVLGP